MTSSLQPVLRWLASKAGYHVEAYEAARPEPHPWRPIKEVLDLPLMGQYDSGVNPQIEIWAPNLFDGMRKRYFDQVDESAKIYWHDACELAHWQGAMFRTIDSLPQGTRP